MIRETTITLRVSWDPTTQDHPMAWEWASLLECDVIVLDFEDEKEKSGSDNS